MQQVNYILKNNEKLNIRSHIGKQIKSYLVPQGACSDNYFIYIIFERKIENKCKIVKLDAITLQVVKISEPLSIGHGNDITYYNNKLYITYSNNKSVISIVDANTLQLIQQKEVKFKKKLYFNGICKCNEGFLLRIMNSRGMLVTDNDFNGIKYYKTNWFYSTSQSMTNIDNYVIRSYSSLQSTKKNFICIFDINGKKIKKIPLQITGELESVFFINNQLYGLVYYKENIDNNINYKTYLVHIPIMISGDGEIGRAPHCQRGG